MFRLQETTIDLTDLRKDAYNPANGALVNFEGIVRADQRKDSQVSALLYFADIVACAKEGTLIIEVACARFQLTKAVCIQRIGQVNVGETAVWIGAWSSHRPQAFDGCRFIIEEVKKRLIIWKKEIYKDGTSAWIHGIQTARL